MRPIAVFGAGGHGREVLELIHAVNDAAPTWRVDGFVVDTEYETLGSVCGYPVLGSIEWLAARPDVDVAIAIGAPRARRTVVERFRGLANRLPPLVHPRAVVGRRVQLGSGTVVFAGSILTTDIVLGDHVHINSGCTVGHDCVLGDFATLYQAVAMAGNVWLGEGVEAGTGARFIPNVEVGAWSVVGAGAVVLQSLAEGVTAVGVPARVVHASRSA